MMRFKKPYVATLDRVKILRCGDTTIIEYLDPTVASTHFTLGSDADRLTDQEILDRFNETLVTRERLAATYHHVAVEIPPGRPQVWYFEAGDQWVPRGDVLRCVVHDGGPGGEAVIEIDDHEFSLAEFGKLLTTHAGWGMRICFVPDNVLTNEPEVEMREPED